MTSDPRKTLSLRLSLGLAFALVVAASSIGMGVSTYLISKNHFRNELMVQIMDLARTSASLIDAETHAKITSPEHQDGEDYQKIKSWLQKIKEANPRIYFIYTMRKTENGNEFIVDAETDPEEMSSVGDLYEEHVEALEATFSEKTVNVEKEFSTDQWGTFQSGFAPILNQKGELEGIIGIDISAADILASEAYIRNLTMGCSLIILILALVISVHLARRISISLSAVVENVNKVQALNLEDPPSTQSVISEIKLLHGAVSDMRIALRSFRKFVPIDLVMDLLTLKQETKLGTTKKELTILFTDIADFTTISERLSADDLSSNMSQYLDIIAQTIKEKTGTLDKFIGDAVMAFWGAPKECPEHARLACEAALECKSKLDRLNEKFQKQGFPIFYTRFGLNTGESIVGNMGTDSRMSFTTIGDPVNLAARTEGLNKVYDTEILVCENTYRIVKDQFVFRRIDQVIVKGKTEPMNIYQLMSTKAFASPELLHSTDSFNQAMDFYFSGKYDKALSAFKVLSYAEANDPVIKNTIARIETTQEESQKTGHQSFSPTVMRHK